MVASLTVEYAWTMLICLSFDATLNSRQPRRLIRPQAPLKKTALLLPLGKVLDSMVVAWNWAFAG